MNPKEEIINLIAQNKIDFNFGIQFLLEDSEYNFIELFSILKFFIFNAIPNKENYNSEAYQHAINTIPLKPTYTPIVILKNFSTRTAFNKLENLPQNNIKRSLFP